MSSPLIASYRSLPFDVDLEVRKIERYIQDLSSRLNDSELEMGTSVRLSVECRELNAYLRGILFALGQQPPWESCDSSLKPDRPS